MTPKVQPSVWQGVMTTVEFGAGQPTQDIDPITGKVVRNSNGGVGFPAKITHYDVQDYRERHAVQELPFEIPITDLGYWIDGDYRPAEWKAGSPPGDPSFHSFNRTKLAKHFAGRIRQLAEGIDGTGTADRIIALADEIEKQETPAMTTRQIIPTRDARRLHIQLTARQLDQCRRDARELLGIHDIGILTETARFLEDKLSDLSALQCVCCDGWFWHDDLTAHHFNSNAQARAEEEQVDAVDLVCPDCLFHLIDEPER